MHAGQQAAPVARGLLPQTRKVKGCRGRPRVHSSPLQALLAVARGGLVDLLHERSEHGNTLRELFLGGGDHSPPRVATHVETHDRRKFQIVNA